MHTALDHAYGLGLYSQIANSRGKPMKYCPSQGVDRYFADPSDYPRWHQFTKQILSGELRKEFAFGTLFNAVEIQLAWASRSQLLGITYFPDRNADEEYATVGFALSIRQSRNITGWMQVFKVVARPAPNEDRGWFIDSDGYPQQHLNAFKREWRW